MNDSTDDFPQSDDEIYNLYKSFHFSSRSDPSVCRATFSLLKFSAAGPMLLYTQYEKS